MRAVHVVSFVLGAIALSACAAVLGLPDPALDEGISPVGGDGATPTGDATSSADGPVDDGGKPIDSGSDAKVDGGGRCDLSKAFAGVTRIAALASAKDDVKPTLTANELMIMWAQHDLGTPNDMAHVYYATRASEGAQWSAPQPLFNGTLAASPCLTGEAKILYFSGGALTQGSVSSIVEAAGKYPEGNAKPEPGLQGSGVALCGSLLADGSMYLHRENAAAGQPAIMFRAQRDSATMTFLSPQPVPGVVNGASSTRTIPVSASDEKLIFYAQAINGARHIFQATRASDAGSFANETAVAELNSTAEDLPGWLSPDGCRLYFSSNRSGTGGAGGHDLYVATRGR
jgi:hypothetical protein